MQSPERLDNVDLGPLEGRSDLTDVSCMKARCDQTYLADTHLTELVTNLNSLVKSLAEHISAKETTGESVTGTVGVDNLVLGKLGDGVSLRVRVLGLEVEL